MKVLDLITRALTIAGAVNWGAVGLLQTDLVAGLFGQFAPFVYAVVGVCGVYQLVLLINGLTSSPQLAPRHH